MIEMRNLYITTALKNLVSFDYYSGQANIVVVSLSINSITSILSTNVFYFVFTRHMNED